MIVQDGQQVFPGGIHSIDRSQIDTNPASGELLPPKKVNRPD